MLGGVEAGTGLPGQSQAIRFESNLQINRYKCPVYHL